LPGGARKNGGDQRRGRGLIGGGAGCPKLNGGTYDRLLAAVHEPFELDFVGWGRRGWAERRVTAAANDGCGQGKGDTEAEDVSDFREPKKAKR
jgi:hypothetical protein